MPGKAKHTIVRRHVITVCKVNNIVKRWREGKVKAVQLGIALSVQKNCLNNKKADIYAPLLLKCRQTWKIPDRQILKLCIFEVAETEKLVNHLFENPHTIIKFEKSQDPTFSSHLAFTHLYQLPPELKTLKTS